MGRQLRTVHELEILARMRMPLGVAIVVLEDRDLAWAAKVIARPTQAFELQIQVDDIAADLRSEYDLLK